MEALKTIHGGYVGFRTVGTGGAGRVIVPVPRSVKSWGAVKAPNYYILALPGFSDLPRVLRNDVDGCTSKVTNALEWPLTSPIFFDYNGKTQSFSKY